MNKKISTTFAVLVILIIAGFFGYVFLMGNENTDMAQEENIDDDQISTVRILKNLNSNYLDDISIIDLASDNAKEWESDASLYGFAVIVDDYLKSIEYMATFNSKKNTKEKYSVFLKNKEVVSFEEEEIKEKTSAGNIDVESIKISSQNAFDMCDKLAKEKINTNDYDIDFLLSHFKSINAVGWRYVLSDKLTNEDSQALPPVINFECIVNVVDGTIKYR